MARNTYELDEKLDSPFNIGHIKRSFHYVKFQGFRLILSLTLNTLVILLGLLSPFFTKIIIDDCIPNKDIKKLLIITALFVGTIVLSNLLNYFQAVITSKAGQNIIHKIREDLYEHLQKLPFSYYDNRPHGKILVRVVNYVNNIAGFLSGGLINIILQLFTLFFIIFFMLSMNIKLSLIVFSGLPFLMVFIILTKSKQRKNWQDFSNKNSNLNAYLNESITGVKVTQSFAREKYNMNIFNWLITEVKDKWMKAIKIMFSLSFIIENISVIILCLVYLTGTIVFKDISLGVLIAMGAYAGRFWQPIQALGNVYNELINTTAYLERIFETLDEPVEIKDEENVIDLEMKGEIEFKNVTFSYEEGFNVLENVSFKVKVGESIALVGPTGAGKTTIVNLLSRFYDINSGEILIDNTPIKNISINSLRRNMGVMLQDSFIFKGTIYDNIRYGKLDATDKQVIETSKIVCAHSFVKKMSDGYNTEINERGSSLSSGQRQLISFARTLISNPKILILDEATSSIDTETEHYLQEGIKSLLKGRTSFIIAHRLSTIKNCDRIFYICDKGICESGSHNELMEKKGLYYELYTSQLNEL